MRDLLLLLIVLVVLGCSNFLIDPRVAPDGEPLQEGLNDTGQLVIESLSAHFAFDAVNAANAGNFSFEISGGQVGAVYNYRVSSPNDESTINGSGTLDESGSDIVSGLDLTGFSDGFLTLQIGQRDASDQLNVIVECEILKDTVIPTAPAVNLSLPDPLTSTHIDYFSFSLSGGESGLILQYDISSDGGGGIVRGEGTFDASGNFTLSGISLAPLFDGLVTLSVRQLDEAGNLSPEGRATITLEAGSDYDSEYSVPVDPDNVGSYSFYVYGFPGASYSFSITSSNGGSVLIGSGTISAGGYSLVGPLDLSVLNDGWLVFSLSITDWQNNSYTQTFVVEKSSVPPLYGRADFSSETESICFDLSFHGTQTIRDGLAVKYDTKDSLGTDFDDVFMFSALEHSESFYIDGAGGYNTIDLSQYTGDKITIESNDYMTPVSAGNRSGTVIVDLGSGESAEIRYSNIENFIFNSKIFDGTPHGLRFYYPSNGGAYFKYYDSSLVEIRVQPSLSTLGGADDQGKLAFVEMFFKGSMNRNYEAVVTLNSLDYKPSSSALPYGDGAKGWHNTRVMLDYIDENNYKDIAMEVANQRWRFSEVTGGLSTDYLFASDASLVTGSSVRTEFRITGTDGRRLELWKGAEGSEVKVTEYDFPDSLDSGNFAVAATSSWAEYSLQFIPSDWAPYVKTFDVKVSRSAGADVQIDLLGNALDWENQQLSLTGLSSGNGTLTDNGDGTVSYELPASTFYGIDSFTYEVSDGTNVSTGVIRFDVVP